MELSNQERKALLTTCLLAASADGARSPEERAAIERIAREQSSEDVDLGSLYQDVLLGKARVPDVARALTSPASRDLAFEMATCVCNADDVLHEREREFLGTLADELGLPRDRAESVTRRSESVVAEAIGGDAPADDAAVDAMVKRTAILAGALELLPQTLASMAILPLQMRMVYRVGKHYGYDLDRGHVKDLLGTVGIGLSSQLVEKFARRLVGGLVGSFLGGGLIKGLARQATGSAFAYASTLALGQVAKRYYASDRSLSGAQLKDAFTSLFSSARKDEASHRGEIEREARGLNVKDLVPLVRGS